MPSSSSGFPPGDVDPFLSEHDATWRDALHRLEAYPLSCLEGLFSEGDYLTENQLNLRLPQAKLVAYQHQRLLDR
jgi:hypothetical protein